MKRFTKISLIAAAVLTVLGIVGVGVGFLFGAKPSQLAQNLHVPASSFAGIREHDRNGSGGDSAERTYDSTIRKLELDVTNASVSIGTSEDNLISIKTRNAGKYFKESVRDGDTLILEDDRPNGNTALELQILLPDRMFDDMDLDLGAAELTAGKLQAREFSLDMGAGSGSIDTLLASEDASIDVGVGELTIGYFDGSELELECGTGSLAIMVAGEEPDYNYELECGIGSIDIGGSSYSGLSSEHFVDNGAPHTISADCGIGEISLQFDGAQHRNRESETKHHGSEL